MAISYNPMKDELVIKFRPAGRKPSKVIDGFKLWWDEEGNICAVGIAPYVEVLEEFKKNLCTARLGGLWKGIKITEDEIEQTRHELIKKALSAYTPRQRRNRGLTAKGSRAPK